MIATAEKMGISVIYFHLKDKTAFVVDNDIVIDERKIATRQMLNKIVAHEIGHIKTGAVYALSYFGVPFGQLVISRAERKANVYAYQLLVPLKKLKEELKKSSDDYEIAEALDVDINTLHNAVEYYRGRNLLN